MPDLPTTRARAASRLARAFRERSEELGEGRDLDLELLGKQLEVCAWNYVIRTAPPGFELSWDSPSFRYRYTTKCVSLEQNIRHRGNPELARRLLRRELGLKALVAMAPWEVFPAQWEAAFERVARRQLQCIIPLPHANEHVDGAVQCSNCKSFKTTYTSLQTRAADEPATLFFYCFNCSKRWKH